jgi:hypothetical protein
MRGRQPPTHKAEAAACFRVGGLTGNDEQLVERTDTETAIALLTRVCGCERDQVARLTPGERDLLLAAIYQKTYSSRIEGTVRCPSCSQPFDVNFILDELLQTVGQSGNDEAIERLADDTFRTPDGVRFRLPTGEDELAVRGLPPLAAERELLRRCIIESASTPAEDSVQEAMERVSPILDLTLDARCPECGAMQKVQFNLQLYLLQAVAQERKQLWSDANRLATAYHWSLSEIFGLARADRRLLVSIIESGAARRTGM